MIYNISQIPIKIKSMFYFYSFSFSNLPTSVVFQSVVTSDSTLVVYLSVYSSCRFKV